MLEIHLTIFCPAINLKQVFVRGCPARWGVAERTFQSMNWERSQTIALAKTTCTHCHGYGLRPGRNEREVPCNCVFRAVFRACYARFRDCVSRDRHLSRVQLEFCNGKDNRITYGRKVEEYIADFCLVSRNALSPLEYDIFRFHEYFGGTMRNDRPRAVAIVPKRKPARVLRPPVGLSAA